MHKFASFLSVLTLCVSAQAGDRLTMLVGTYTTQGTSRGIYTFAFNQRSGQFVPLDSVEAGNPSFLTVDDERKHVYAVSEYDDGRQGVLSFAFDRKSGHLTSLGEQRCGVSPVRQDNRMPGAAPCNIMLLGRNVVTSNYNGGDLSVFPLLASGGLGPENQYFDLHVAGSEAVSHIHCCRLTPDGRYLLAADLGNDCLWRFAVGADGKLLPDPVMAYRAPKGTGPRHFIFNDRGDRIYLMGELDGTVTVLSYADGTLAELQRVQASLTRTQGSADIHLSPDGRFLYTSHRLRDEGVAIFSVDTASGLVSRRAFQPTSAHPRNFAITPNGRFLLVACRDSNTIEVYRREPLTGLLTPMRRDIHVGQPVCVVFVP